MLLLPAHFISIGSLDEASGGPSNAACCCQSKHHYLRLLKNTLDICVSVCYSDQEVVTVELTLVQILVHTSYRPLVPTLHPPAPNISTLHSALLLLLSLALLKPFY